MAHPWTASVMREMNLQSPGVVQPLDIGSGEHGTPERAPYRELPRVQPAVATARPAGWALESDGIHLPLLRVQFERPRAPRPVRARRNGLRGRTTDLCRPILQLSPNPLWPRPSGRKDSRLLSQ